MKTIKLLSALCAAAATFGLAACMDTDAQYTVADSPAPTFTGVICNSSDTVYAAGNTLATGMQLYPGDHSVSVMFDENIGFATSTANQITLNGNPVNSAVVYGASKILSISFTAPAVNELTLTIPAGLVYGPSKKANEQEIVITWASINVSPATSLVNSSATSEAKALYQTLLDNYGTKILSGTMANVNWNNENAEQVYQWTGKYPAINCYDFIHLPYDGSWINYSDMTPVTEWHNAGGIVNAMWHWNVPTVEPEDEPQPQPGDGDETTLANEEKVMPSDWSGWYKIEASDLSGIQVGDVITAHTKDVLAGAQGSFKDGSSWSGLVDGNGTSYEYFDISGNFSLTVDATILAAIQANGLIISGHDYTLTSVTASTSSSAGGGTTLASEEKVMPSDWSGWYKIEASDLSAIQVGDVITAHTKDVLAGAQGSFKDGSSWSGLVDGNGTSYEYFDISGDFSITVDATILAAIQANGLIISGHDYTLTGVTASTSASSSEGTTLASEEKVMPTDWSGWYKIEASNLANVKVGDVITAQTKDVLAGAQGSFKDGSSWSGLVDGSGKSYEYFDISGDFSITVDATILAAIQANGLIISGHDYTLTGVTLASASAAPKRVKSANIQYTVRPNETTFKPSNCLIEGTWENEVWTADLAKVAGYLKTMQDLGIPVLWRPFHEAKGNYDVYEAGTGAWFWWGAEGPEVFKKLWYAMFYYMQEQGINNLIWVWTDIPTAIDTKWYPGDDFVDIVGVDIYSQTDGAAVATIMKQLQYTYTNKMVTLSECGGVAEIKDQFEAGATWSWFMPWYEGEGTNYAPQEWWQNAMNCEYVITRDMLK